MVRCGCASDVCSCTVTAGDGITVAGAGSPKNPYVVTSNVSELDTGVVVQDENVTRVSQADILDFQGAGVTVTSGGLNEAIITIPGATGGTGATIPPGTMMLFGGTVAPTGWLLCDGHSYLVATYPTLYGAIANRFGGDATNFNVPNLVDRVPIGASATKPIGTAGGSATKSIATANLPPHAHPMPHAHTFGYEYSTGPSGTGARVTDIANKTGGGGFAATVTTSQPTTANTSNTGSGTPLDVLPPYLPLTFIIKT